MYKFRIQINDKCIPKLNPQTPQSQPTKDLLSEMQITKGE